MRWIPTREMIAQSWQKYGLIVVGNIVFFVLLYFISYRPNNDEHRAAELLAMAQEQETQGRAEAASVLYGKVLSRYPKTEASRMAKTRIVAVEKWVASRAGVSKVQIVTPQLDLSEMLDRRPSLYVATYLAAHYGDDPALKPKLRAAILAYLGAAMRIDGLTLADLRREKELRAPDLETELFAMRPACAMTPDFVYDDFAVRNDNFFPWHNANVKIEVKQGSEILAEEIRVEELAPGASIDVLEFRVKGAGGVVSCTADVNSAEGKGSWSGKI
jgi:hypothetical protein